MRALLPIAVAGLVVAAASCGSRTGLFVDARDTVDAAPDAPLDGAVPCTPGTFDFDLAVTQLMFVLDRSGSMRFDLQGNANQPRSSWRWTLLQDALAQTILPFDDQLAMGAKFFPEPDVTDSQSAVEACRIQSGVGIAPVRGNARTILDAFTPDPLGGTPTSDAVRFAAQFLSTSRSVARTIVLATDGAPNCNGEVSTSACICTSRDALTGLPSCGGRSGAYSCLDDVRTIDTIRGIAEQQKIPVYVIGLGNDSATFRDTLDAMAVAGGRPRTTTPRHYSVQSPGDLTTALASIRDTVARCTYLTPSAPTDPDGIIVRIGGRTIRRDPSQTNGWDWIDQTFGSLVLFGDACAEAQGSDAGTVQPAPVSGQVTCNP